MKAIRLHARGGPEAFAYEEAPQPHPEEGEVLVRVHAAAVTPTELAWVPTWTTPTGEPRRFPIILGHEFSGEVAAVGRGVTSGPTRRDRPPDRRRATAAGGGCRLPSRPGPSGV